MKDRFIISFEQGMPKGTAQQKGYNRYTGSYYKKSKISQAETLFALALKPYAPKARSVMPIKLSIWFYYNIKEKRKWGKPKISKPDVDNFAKAFIDQMTKTGFWLDDSQITSLHLEKYYAEKATIVVQWEEIYE